MRQYFYFSTDLDTYLDWCTPWFAIILAYGARRPYDCTLWYGFKIWWKRQKNIEEGPDIFANIEEVCFRSYDMQAVREGLLPL